MKPQLPNQLKLFGQQVDKSKNWLPYDGKVLYYGKIMSPNQADVYYQQLFQSLEWKNDEAIIFGKKIITKRKVAWYGNKTYPYSYSNTTKLALPWTSELVELKKLVEDTSGESFNSCLVNLYHDGSEGMAYHSDGEKDLKKDGAIASLSLGAERKLSFKHKESKERIDLHLEHGSLLMMMDKTQTHWLHRLPPTKKVNQPRINLTFRTIDAG